MSEALTTREREDWMRGSVPGSSGVPQEEMTRTDLIILGDRYEATVRRLEQKVAALAAEAEHLRAAIAEIGTKRLHGWTDAEIIKWLRALTKPEGE